MSGEGIVLSVGRVKVPKFAKEVLQETQPVAHLSGSETHPSLIQNERA